MVLNIVVAFSLCNTKTYFDTGEPPGMHHTVQIIFFLQNADDCNMMTGFIVCLDSTPSLLKMLRADS
jgi:hypothetical protein